MSWCVGLDGDAVMVARHDGSDVRRLTLKSTQSGQRIVADRFVFNVFMDGGATVYDAEAGKYLTAPAPAGSEQWDSAQLSGGVSTNPFYVWTVTAPGKPNSLRILQLGEAR